MTDITIGSTYYDRQMNRIHVVDIAENFNNKSGENSKVVLYRKNKTKRFYSLFMMYLYQH